MAVDVVLPPNMEMMETPPELELRSSEVDNTVLGIWTKTSISSGDKFGPFVGEKVTEASPSMDSTYVWEIVDLETKEFLFYIDATKPDKGNWMRYIQCARYFEEQNIVSQQEGIDIYYKAIKDIGPGEELLTWYEKIPLRKGRGKKFTRRSGNIKPRSRSGSTDSNQSVKLEKAETRPRFGRRGSKMSTKEQSQNIEPSALDKGDGETGGHCADTEPDKVSLNSFSSGQSKQDETSSTHSQGMEPGKYMFELHSVHVVKSRLGRKVFKCDVCSGVYRHAFSLKRHFIRNHVNYKYVSKADMLNCNINLDFYMPPGTDGEFPNVKQEICDTKSEPTPEIGEVDINENSTSKLDVLEKSEKDCPSEATEETHNSEQMSDVEVKKEIVEEKTDGPLNDNEEIVKECEKDDNADDISSPRQEPGLKNNEDNQESEICTPGTDNDSISKETKPGNNKNNQESETCTPETDNDSISKETKPENNKNNQESETCTPETDNDIVSKETKPGECENVEIQPEKSENSASPKSEIEDSKAGQRSGARKESLSSSSAMPGLFRCNVCHEKFDTIGALKGHIINHPVLPSRAFSCDSCDMKFSHKQNLMRHLAVHTGAKPYSCKFCGKKFPTVTNQKRHERIHMGRRISCEYCQSTFTQSGDLKKHMRKLHPESFHDCAFCGKFFVREDQLEDHLITSHQENLDSNALEAVRRRQAFNVDLETDRLESMRLAQQTKPGFKFACTICKKRFHDYANMCRHRRLAHQRHLLITKGNSFDSPLPSPTKSVCSEHGELDPHVFYANVAKNISENLNHFIEGKLEHLANLDSHIKWKGSSGNLSKTVSIGPKHPAKEPVLTMYNFPPEFEYQEDKITPVEQSENKIVLSVPNGFTSHGSLNSGRIKVQEVKPFNISASNLANTPPVLYSKPSTEMKSPVYNDSQVKSPPPAEQTTCSSTKSAIKVPSVHICSYCRSIFHNSELFRQHMFLKHKAPLPPLEPTSSRKAESVGPDLKRPFTDSLLSIPCYSAHKSKKPVLCGGALDLSKGSNVTDADFLAMAKGDNSDSDSDDLCPLDLSMSSCKGSLNLSQSQPKESPPVIDLTCKEVLDPKLEYQNTQVLSIPKYRNSESHLPKSIEQCGVSEIKSALERTNKHPELSGQKQATTVNNREMIGHKPKVKNTNIKSAILNRPHVHICSVCQKRFEEIEELLIHQDEEHPNVKCSPLTLDAECSTPWWPSLNPVGLLNVCSSGLPPTSDDSTEQKFICTKCGTSFVTMPSLHSHIVTCASQGKEDTKHSVSRFKHHRRSKFNKGLGRLNIKKRVKKKVGRPSDATVKSKLRKNYLDGRNRAEPSPVKRAILRKIKQQQLEDDLDSLEEFSFKRRRRRNFELLYNPKKHARRREQTEFLDMHRCRGCHLRFQTISLLERHIRTCIHKDRFKDIKVMKPMVTAFGQSNAKKHMCRYCDKQFTYMGSLRKHVFGVCIVRKSMAKRGDVLATDWEIYVTESARVAKEGLVRQLSGSSADDNVEIKRRKRKGKRKNHGWGYVKKRRVSKEAGDAEVDSMEFVDGEGSKNDDAAHIEPGAGTNASMVTLGSHGNSDEVISRKNVDLASEFDNNSVATSEMTDEYDINYADDKSCDNSEDMKLSDLVIKEITKSASDEISLKKEITESNSNALPNGAACVNSEVTRNNTDEVKENSLQNVSYQAELTTKTDPADGVLNNADVFNTGDQSGDLLLPVAKIDQCSEESACKKKSDSELNKKTKQVCDANIKSFNSCCKENNNFEIVDSCVCGGLRDSSISDSLLVSPSGEKCNEPNSGSPPEVDVSCIIKDDSDVLCNMKDDSVSSKPDPKQGATPKKEVKSIKDSENKELGKTSERESAVKESRKKSISKGRKSEHEETKKGDLLALDNKTEETKDSKDATQKKKKVKKLPAKCEIISKEDLAKQVSPTKMKKKAVNKATEPPQKSEEMKDKNILPRKLKRIASKTEIPNVENSPKKKKLGNKKAEKMGHKSIEVSAGLIVSPVVKKKGPYKAKESPSVDEGKKQESGAEAELDAVESKVQPRGLKRVASKRGDGDVENTVTKKKQANKKAKELSSVKISFKTIKKTPISKLKAKKTVATKEKVLSVEGEAISEKQTFTKMTPKKKAKVNTKLAEAAIESTKSEVNETLPVEIKLKKKPGKKCRDKDKVIVVGDKKVTKKRKGPASKKGVNNEETSSIEVPSQVNPQKKSPIKKTGKSVVNNASDPVKITPKKKGGKLKQTEELAVVAASPKKPGPKKKSGPGKPALKPVGKGKVTGKVTGGKDPAVPKGPRKKGGK